MSDASAPGLTPSQRLAILRREGRLPVRRSADASHKAEQEARVTGAGYIEGGSFRRAASATLSSRERATCIPCLGTGEIVLPPDVCGEEYYDVCPECGGDGKVIVR